MNAQDVLSQAAQVPALHFKLRRIDSAYVGLSDGTALDLLYETGGDVDRAAQLAFSRQVPGTHGVPGCPQICLSAPPAQAATGPVNVQNDPKLQARAAQLIGLLAERGVTLPREQAEVMVELAEGLPRVMATRGRHLVRASMRTIADVTYDLATRWRARGYRSFVPPMMVMQGLYPQVSINGANLGFRTERQYADAVMCLIGYPPARYSDESAADSVSRRLHALQHEH